MGSFTGSALGDFNYQSYGAWARGNIDDVLTRATSTGPATTPAAIPTTGTATYTGTAKGFYWINGNAQSYATTANMNAGVDFASREVAFSTSNTTVAGGPPDGPQPFLDLSGTLRYGAGSNDIRGTVTTRSGEMSGPAQARFYGPQAQEIGGVYRVEPAQRGATGMTGGFGGKK
jgi:transferrin binding protein